MFVFDIFLLLLTKYSIPQMFLALSIVENCPPNEIEEKCQMLLNVFNTRGTLLPLLRAAIDHEVATEREFVGFSCEPQSHPQPRIDCDTISIQRHAQFTPHCGLQEIWRKLSAQNTVSSRRCYGRPAEPILRN